MALAPEIILPNEKQSPLFLKYPTKIQTHHVRVSMKTNWILTLMIPALIACGKGGFQSTSSERVNDDLSLQQPQMPQEWERIPTRSKPDPAKPTPAPGKTPAPTPQNPVEVPQAPAPAPQKPAEPKPTPTPPKPAEPQPVPAPTKPVEPQPAPSPGKVPVPTPQKPVEPAPVPKEPQKTPPKAPVPPKETPKPQPPPTNPEKPPQKPDEAYPNDFQFRGELTPTVYFHPLLRDEENNCKSGKWKALRGAKGVELMTVCSTTLQVCAMEGTCQISRKTRTRSFNYRGMSGGQYVFFELLPGDCSYGYGVKSSCLDPFYTVAADLKHHNPGDVIYIPKVAGVILPNGKKHSGFFIVRDSGGMIKGPHRFDFYSGTLKWNDPRNPFYRIQLSDSNRRFAYSRVSGTTALKVLNERAYPNLPKADVPMQMFSFEVEDAASSSQLF